MAIFRAFRAVFWSFFGVRKGRDHDADIEHLKPVQVIVAGLIGAAIFVLSLVLLVNWITR